MGRRQRLWGGSRGVCAGSAARRRPAGTAVPPPTWPATLRAASPADPRGQLPDELWAQKVVEEACRHQDGCTQPRIVLARKDGEAEDGGGNGVCSPKEKTRRGG
jgi:hypothetical protein